MANMNFYTASTIKVPLTMLVADTVASGQKMDRPDSYNAEEDYEEGTGIIAYNIQPEYPLKRYKNMPSPILIISLKYAL